MITAENVTNVTNEAKRGPISVTLTKTTGCLDTMLTVDAAGDYLMTFEELARYTGFSKIYWYKLNSAKKMPSEIRVFKFGRRAVKVWRSDVSKWIEKHQVEVNVRSK